MKVQTELKKASAIEQCSPNWLSEKIAY